MTRPPSAIACGSPPASSPTYPSPSRPDVRIDAIVSLVNVYWRSIDSVTTASKVVASSRIASTRPTATPAAFTGARTLRPPMLSNAASIR